MRMLGWNCQGTGKGLGNPKMCHLARMIVATRAQVIFISEDGSGFGVAGFPRDVCVLSLCLGVFSAKRGQLFRVWMFPVYSDVIFV